MPRIEKGKNTPLGQAQQKVLSRALSKARNAEPARLAVILGPAVASDCVLEDIAAAAGRLQLRSVGEVANDGDAGEGARRGGAECAGGDDGGGGAAEEERRHVGGDGVSRYC